MRTHETRDIQPKLGTADLKRYAKLRFNWNTPIALSPHDPATVYIGAQFLLPTVIQSDYKDISNQITACNKVNDNSADKSDKAKCGPLGTGTLKKRESRASTRAGHRSAACWMRRS